MATTIDEAIVALKLQDDLSEPMARAVAEARAEAEALGHIKAKIKVDADTAKARAELVALKKEYDSLGKAEKKAATDLKARIKAQADAVAASQRAANATSLISRQIIANDSAEAKSAQAKARKEAAAEKLAADAAKARAEAEKAAAKERTAAEKAAAQEKIKAEKAAAAEAVKVAREEAAAKRQLAAEERARAKEAAAEERQKASEARKAAAEEKARAKEAAKDAELERTAALRHAQELTKGIQLEKQYLDAKKRVSDTTKLYNRSQGSDKMRASIDVLQAVRQMEVLRETLKLMGREPVDIKTKLDKPSGLRGKFQSLTGGQDPRMLRDIGNEIGGLAGKLKEARINIGPFSTSMYGLLTVGSALAPVITGLIGALGSLVAVAGAGIGGALGVGATAMTGFGMAAVGMLSNIKPFVQQLQLAHQHQLVLDAAIAKYGANSKKGIAAQQAYNHQMASMPPLARKTADAWRDLHKQWTGLTKGVADQSIGNMVGSTFKMMRANMGWFAKDTNQAFTTVSHGWSGLMHDFSSGQGKSSLQNIFGNFNSFLQPVLGGFRSLAGVGLHMMSGFSKFMPSLGGGFKTWADNIKKASDHSGGFSHGIQQMVDSMRALGHFAMAAGRMLMTFFRAGVGPGIGFVNDMTHAMDRLSKKMATTSGQTKLHDFFARSIETTKQLWNALMPLISAFVQFAQATAPVANIMLTIISAFTKLVSLAVGFKPIQFIVGGLAALAILSKMTAGLREAVMLGKSLGKSVFAFGSTVGRMGLKDALKGAFGGGSTASAMAPAAAALEGAAASQEAAAAATEAAAFATERAAGALTVSAERQAFTPPIGSRSTIPGATTAPLASRGAATAEQDAARLAAAEQGAAAAAGNAAPAVATLGSRIMAFATNPVTLALAAVGGLAAALILLADNTNGATTAARGAATTHQALRTVRGSIHGEATQNPAFNPTPVMPLGGSAGQQKAINAAAREFYKLQREGKASTEAGQAALSRYNDLLIQHANDLKNAADFQKGVRDSIKATVNTQSGAQVKAMKGVAEAQKGVNQANDKYNTDLHNIHTTGVQRLADLNNLQKAEGSLHDAQKTQNAVIREAIVAGNLHSAVLLNQQRSLQGVSAISQTYAQTVGGMVRSLANAGPAGGRALAALSKIPDPAKVVQLSRAYNQLSSAADKTKAMKIMANTADPARAVALLNSLVIREKILHIRANLGDTLVAIARIEGKRLTPKILQMLHSGDPAVMAAAAKLIGIRLPPKVLKLLGDAADAQAKHHQVEVLRDITKALTIMGNNGQAIKSVGDVIAAVANLHDKTVTITTNNDVYNRIFNIPAVGSPRNVQKHATGANSAGVSGAPVSTSLARLQDRASRDALRRATGNLRGGMYNKPTYLVGEENRAEYVISTNPAYKRGNMTFLKQAAQALGAQVIGAATGHAPAHPKAKKAKPPKSELEYAAGTGPKHQHHQDSVYALKPYERIGGVGTQDISDRISMWQTRAGNDKTAYDRIAAQVRADQRTANQSTHSKSQRNAARTAHDHLYGKNGELEQEKAAKKKLANTNRKVKTLNQLLTAANDEIQRFTSLESDQTNVNALMQAANSSKSGMSTGINPLNGQMTTANWDQWDKVLQVLDKKHTSELKKALQDASNLTLSPSETNLGYLHSLSTALGQSIATQIADEGPNTGGAGTSAGAPLSAARTVSDFLAGQGMTDWEATLEGKYTTGQIDAARNPGDPLGMTEQQSAVSSLVDFWSNEWQQAKNFRDPTTGAPDNVLIKDVGDVLLQWIQTQTGLNPQGGATAGQTLTNAMSSSLSQYGSNANIIQGVTPGISGLDVASALMGGGAAASALETQGAARLSAASGGAPPVQAAASADASSGHVVHNHFSHPPADPHAWSKGILWELNA